VVVVGGELVGIGWVKLAGMAAAVVVAVEGAVLTGIGGVRLPDWAVTGTGGSTDAGAGGTICVVV
jgi:hypothetical protein